MSDEDDTPYDPVANLDQAIAELSGIAKMAYALFTRLVTEGFEPAQALVLTGEALRGWTGA